MTGHMVELAAPETHELRRRVLRAGMTTQDVDFAEDHREGTVHLGWRVDGVLVATSTWVPASWQDEPAIQLRGMAVNQQHQGGGFGGLLLDAGLAAMTARGHGVLWARARDAALDFYCRHGFVVVGDGFIDDTTQLPHHHILWRHHPR
jgi:predicted GNAT family N-acyltransferase